MASLDTVFDLALFDSPDYGFDADSPVTEVIPLPTQIWKRGAAAQWVRRP